MNVHMCTNIQSLSRCSNRRVRKLDITETKSIEIVLINIFFLNFGQKGRKAEKSLPHDGCGSGSSSAVFCSAGWAPLNSGQPVLQIFSI